MAPLFFLLVVFITCGHAYVRNYGPFEKHEEPDVFPIHKAGFIESHKKNVKGQFTDRNYFVRDGNNMMTIEIFFLNHPCCIFAQVKNQEGTVLVQPIKVSMSPHALGDVYWAYLNEDNKKDFIIQSWSGGSGLAAYICDVTFILSTNKGYEANVLTTFNPTRSDFIDLFENQKCQFIHTDLIETKARDGNSHRFWLYNLLQFEGPKVVVANDLDDRFPKMVWYTYKANHKATKLLTEAQKRKLLNEQLKKLVRKPELLGKLSEDINK